MIVKKTTAFYTCKSSLEMRAVLVRIGDTDKDCSLVRGTIEHCMKVVEFWEIEYLNCVQQYMIYVYVKKP